MQKHKVNLFISYRKTVNSLCQELNLARALYTLDRHVFRIERARVYLNTALTIFIEVAQMDVGVQQSERKQNIRVSNGSC